MTEEVLPDIRTAALALERSISTAESEIMQHKLAISAKEKLISGWRDMIKTLLPGEPPRKNRFFNLRTPAPEASTTAGGNEIR